MKTLGDLLLPISGELAGLFIETPIPAALAMALKLPPPVWRYTDTPNIPKGAKIGLLAGPEVLRFNAVNDLHRLAHRSKLMVANTWGAKGVFKWADPHHMGTVGLQANDFTLLDFDELDLVIAMGADPLESPDDALRCEVVHVHPMQIESLAIKESSVNIELQEKPPLFKAIAAIAQPGYLSEQNPRHPARCVIDVKRSLPPGGIVVVEPGLLGLWFARTFPTETPGSVVIPAFSAPGLAAVIGLVAAINGHHATVITSEPMDQVTEAVHEISRQIKASIHIESWGPADIDLSATKSLIAAAGEVLAWRT